jgi:NAD(P)-dependent dehydrogenase (short-subunit alcohol dehydrogenase family)
MTPEDSMNQRTAVVTGASSGFGRLTAQTLAADGWRVYATMRNVAGRNAAAAAGLRSSGISVVELDVTNDASVDAAAKTILDEAGTIDVLVNNAGTGYFGIQEAFTPDAVEQQFATNVVGPLRVNRAFLPSMRENKRGLIVYVSSVVGRIIVPSGGVYTASKWALEALAENSAYELAPFGIDVAIVQPGAYATEIFSKMFGADDAARVAAYGDAAGYVGKVSEALGASAQERDSQEVADAILRLANAPAGERPLRTAVPANPAVEAINAAVGPIQREVMKSFGLEAFLPKSLLPS